MIIKMVHGCGAAKDHAAKGDKVADQDQKLETDKMGYIGQRDLVAGLEWGVARRMGTMSCAREIEVLPNVPEALGGALSVSWRHR